MPRIDICCIAILAALPGLLFAPVSQAETLIRVQTIDEEVTAGNTFGIENGRCSLGEAFQVFGAGAVRSDCPRVVRGGNPDPLVLQLQPGRVYTRTDLGLVIFNNDDPNKVIEGNGATIQRAPGSDSEVRLLDKQSDPDGTLVVKDLTLKGGLVTGNGAGLQFRETTVSLVNVNFIDNLSLTEDGNLNTGRGGALNMQESDVVISGSSFINNSADDLGTGGAIYQFVGNLQLSDTLFQSNTASTGGAIYSTKATVEISRSRFFRNQVSALAGAIYVTSDFQQDVYTEISHSEFIENDTFLDGIPTVSGGTGFFLGGAIYSATRALRIDNTLFTGNGASQGGALARALPFAHTIDIENSTFYGNQSLRSGSAIYVEHGPVNLRNVTMVGNDAGGTGALYLNTTNTATAFIDHSIIINNSAAGVDDCQGPRRTDGGGHSLIGQCNLTLRSTDRSVNLFSTDVTSIMSDSLADNGGSTRTVAITPGGFAHNTGSRDFPDVPYSDQRGFPRIAEGRIDIGAYEYAAEKVDGQLRVLFKNSLEADEPRRWFDRDEFQADTGASDIVGQYPSVGTRSDPTAIGGLTLLPVLPSTPNLAQWSNALPDVPDIIPVAAAASIADPTLQGGGPFPETPTVDLALNGLEEFDVRLDTAARSFGFDFVDPNGDSTRFNLLVCASSFDPNNESCPLSDIVFSMDFSAGNTGRNFFGFQVKTPFQQVSFREQTSVNENEFWGHFFTAP